MKIQRMDNCYGRSICYNRAVKIIITDTGIYPGEAGEEDLVIRNTQNIQACTGCGECWTKTPGRCTLKDPLENLGYLLSVCDELLIVSRCLYGSFSSFVQRVLERMTPYLLPFYTGGSSMRHKKRYHHTFTVSACFYGDNLSEMEKEEARHAVQKTAEVLGAGMGSVDFVRDALAAGGLS